MEIRVRELIYFLDSDVMLDARDLLIVTFVYKCQEGRSNDGLTHLGATKREFRKSP